MPAPSTPNHGYANLQFKDGTSDKVYNLTLSETGSGKWAVIAEYGKTGGPMTRQDKTKGGATYAAALSEFTSVYREKTGKGYKVVAEKLPSSVAPAMTPGKGPPEEDLVKKLEKLLAPSLPNKMPVLLEGLPGTGKTFGAREFGKSGGFSAYLEVAGHSGMESYDFLGGTIPIGAGKTVWMDGPVTNAFRLASKGQKVLLCIDEIGRVPSRERGLFLTALTPHDGTYRLRSGRPIDINEKEGSARMEMIVAPVANISIVATTNSGSNFVDVEMDDDAGKERWHILHLKPRDDMMKSILESRLKEKGWPVALSKEYLDLQSNIRKVKEDNFCAKELTPRLTLRVLDLTTGPTKKEIAAAAREMIPALTSRTPEGDIVPEQNEMLEKAISRIAV